MQKRSAERFLRLKIRNKKAPEKALFKESGLNQIKH
jgi:hypothetical protein